MGVNSLPKTVTRQRRGCDLNPSPSAPSECSTLTTRLPSHPSSCYISINWLIDWLIEFSATWTGLDWPVDVQDAVDGRAQYTADDGDDDDAADDDGDYLDRRQPAARGRRQVHVWSRNTPRHRASLTKCYTQGKVTSHSLWSRHGRHFVAITRHNVWSEGTKIYCVIQTKLKQLV